MGEPKFTEVPLGEFHQSKAMWAANRLVLWPLGLALTVVMDEGGRTAEYLRLEVRQWEFDEGHREAIITSDEELRDDEAVFREWLEGRLDSMPAAESHTARKWLDAVLKRANVQLWYTAENAEEGTER